MVKIRVFWFVLFTEGNISNTKGKMVSDNITRTVPRTFYVIIRLNQG